MIETTDDFDINALIGDTPFDAFDVLTRHMTDTLEDNNTFSIDWSQFDDPDDFVEVGNKLFGEEYTDDVKDVFWSVRDNVRTIARSANATGKTHMAARVAVLFLLRFPDAQVYTAAAPPERNLRQLLWGEIGQIVEKYPFVFKGLRVTDLLVKRSAKSFLTGVTIPSSGSSARRQAAFSGKHAPNMLFIFDEADAIPFEVYMGTESCMSGGHVRMLCMFNPRHESGPVYLMERRKQANVVELSAFRHPNVVTGQDVIKGAVNREITLRRINEWTRPLAPGEKVDAECFEVPEFLVGCTCDNGAGVEYPPLPAGWRKIEEHAFSHMVLGRYPAAGEGKLILRTWIDRAVSNYELWVAKYGVKPPSRTRPILGLDVAEYGQDSNALCKRYGNWVAPIVTWGGTDVIDTGERAGMVYCRERALYLCVDATGVGAGAVPAAERYINGSEHQGESYDPEVYRVMMASSPTIKGGDSDPDGPLSAVGEFGILRDQLWWSLRLWLRHNPEAMLPPDELLIEELLTPTYDTSTGKLKVMPKTTPPNSTLQGMKQLLRRSPDRAESLILTFYGETVDAEDADGPLSAAINSRF